MKPSWQGWEALLRRLGGERERRRGSVRPQYKAGILGMEMLPPSPSLLNPVFQSLLLSPGLHEESLERVPASLSTKRKPENSIDKLGVGGQPFAQVWVHK